MRGQLPQRIRQLNTPLNDSLDDTVEEVTVHDPTHPLHGQRFRVAARPTRPDAQGTSLLVFLRETVQVRLPLSATLLVPTGHTSTKLSLEAVTELVATAQACGVCLPNPQTCGEPSPTTCNSPSLPTSQPCSVR
jgi:hypothetical protein